MKEVSYILGSMTLQKADEERTKGDSIAQKSLIVLDELGRGTSATEGAAICWAIAEEIIKLGAFCFLATHFTLLTKLEVLYPTATK